MSHKYVFEIKEGAGARADVFITDKIDGFSRSFVQKHLENGNVRVNGKPVKANYKLREADVLEIEPFAVFTPALCAENIPLAILYEDSDLCVVDKPKGMVAHPAAGHDSGTLANALMYHCKGSLSGINGALRPGIVHRIDKDTSGVIVCAKNDAAHKGLSEQFALHSINRVYEAITINVIKEEEITINRPIGRHPVDRKKMCVTDKNAKNAVTHIRTIQRFPKNTFVEARLETGRTHQIRVHLAHIGYPLLGDQVYGPKKQGVKLDGQALFAKLLGFVHPATGKYMEFQAERPIYLQALLNQLSQ